MSLEAIRIIEKSNDDKLHKMELQLQKQKYIIWFFGVGIIMAWGIFVILS